MKKGILLMYCLVSFLLPHLAFSQDISIAAAHIEPIGVREDTARLRAGRTVSLERELEQEIEIEDLIMLGKMPRKSTVPSKALGKAFIPGQGLVYNGYRNLGLVLPAQLFSLLSLGAYMAVIAPPRRGIHRSRVPPTGTGESTNGT